MRPRTPGILSIAPRCRIRRSVKPRALDYRRNRRRARIRNLETLDRVRVDAGSVGDVLTGGIRHDIFGRRTGDRRSRDLRTVRRRPGKPDALDPARGAESVQRQGRRIRDTTRLAIPRGLIADASSRFATA